MLNKSSMHSVKDLFSEGQQYIIPIYQRNYAWQLPELRQLIQDIWDNYRYNPERNYYIGTLVVYPTPNGLETVDGQQRLTTLNIILSAMKNEINVNQEDDKSVYDWFKRSNLDFEFRKKASDLLKNLYDHIDPIYNNDDTASIDDDTSSIDEKNISYIYAQVRPTIEDILAKNTNLQNFFENFNNFRNYFFNKVIITRVLLPNETDLNHYFEIMNTRGEQLEKHEILKARILNPLRNEPALLWLGNRIWEACSDMSRYVQMGFASADFRKSIFSNDFNTLTAEDFDGLANSAGNLLEQEKTSRFSIKELLENADNDNNKGKTPAFDSKNEDGEERFNSVIDFPGFLLQTLRVMTCEDIPLDDKRLLDTFSPHISQDGQFSKKFLYELLRLRFLFDKFIIKRDFLKDRTRGRWNILKIEVQTKGFSYNNTFNNLQKEKENIMLQSMFHASLPSHNYKHWLCGALLHLSAHDDGNGLYEYLTQLSHSYMLDRFIQSGDNQIDYYNIIFKNGGKPQNTCPQELTLPRFDTNIDIFYFNYLDMQLWLQGLEPNFSFTSRNSVEHFFPQHPIDNSTELPDVHNFGNLCLIAADKNSRFSNFPPYQKTDIYTKSGIDSIKQKLMMDICRQNQDWGESEIIAHAEDMKKVLINSLTNN